jgi:hypothetical protein
MRKKVIRILFIGIIFMMIPIVGFTSDQKKGIVTHADGTVKRQPVEVETWENAPVNTDILSGDKVRTYQESRAELDLAQMDIIRLAPRTIIDIVRLYQETKEKTVKTEIKLEQGELWASVHEVEMETEFDISAPIAAAAITGTILRMNVKEDSTTQLKVYTGEVKITNAPEKKDLKAQPLVKPHQIQGPHEVPGPREVTLQEWVYIVRSMQQITVDNKGKVISSGDFDKNDEEEQSNWVKWNQKRDDLRNRSIQQDKDQIEE